MIPIDDNTAAAENEADLRDAAEDIDITYIYLANNITMLSGITINPNKASFVIDGRYPQETGDIHILTDVEGTNYYDTLGIGTTSSIAITVRDLIINGRNYYGVPYVVENIWPIDTSNVSVTYENVTYNGPQMTYNRYGTTRYLDCTINIARNGSVEPEEVGEVNRVEIGGHTTITHTDDANVDAVFWFNNTTNTSSLTILEDAVVDIHSDAGYFMYNISGLTTPQVAYTVRSGASLRLQTRIGISFNQNHPVQSFRVEDNGSFTYVQTGSNGTAASMYLNGALTVGRGARFYMQAESGTQPLIRFTNGTGRSLTVDNPLSFVLYSPNAAALNSQGTTAFALNGGQVNQWSAARTPVDSAGGFDDRPEFKWFKLNYASPVSLNGTFAQSTTTTTGNMMQEDEPHPLDTDLHLHSARVLSVGDWPVEIDRIVDDGRPITGRTEPNANLIAVYEIEGAEHSISGAALSDGSFSISTSQQTPPTIPAETRVAIWSNIPFLIKTTTAIAVELGELIIFSAPELIEFRLPPILLGPPVLPRRVPEEPVIIRDTRADESQWQLFASITGPLMTEFGDVLTDAMVFTATEGGALVTLGEEPVLVYTGGPGIDPTNVFWPERAGILARITDPIRSGRRYTTYVIWTLQAI